MSIYLNDGWEIETPDGWVDFTGIQRTEVKSTIILTMTDGKKIRSSLGHPFFVNGVYTLAGEIGIGDKIDGSNALVASTEDGPDTELYDIIEVQSKDHKFYINGGIVTKNCDEMSFVPKNVQDAFYTATRPTLSTGGSFLITSTPKSEDDVFGQLWKGANDTRLPNGDTGTVGKNGYKALTADWRQHPDRDEAWAAAEKAAMGEARFAVEHENKFITLDSTLIDPLALQRLSASDPLFKMGEVRWYKNPVPECSYFVVLDPALGTGNDFAAIQVFEMPTLTQVAEWSNNMAPPLKQVQVLHDILVYLYGETTYEDDDEPNIFWSFENNSVGEAVLQVIENSDIENFPGMLISEKRKTNHKKNVRHRKGINTTNKNKILACSKFKSLVDTDRLQVHSIELIKQMKAFTANGASFSGKGTGTDDLMMASIMCVRLIEMVKDWEIFDPDIINDMIEVEEFEPMPFLTSF